MIRGAHRAPRAAQEDDRAAACCASACAHKPSVLGSAPRRRGGRFYAAVADWAGRLAQVRRCSCGSARDLSIRAQDRRLSASSGAESLRGSGRSASRPTDSREVRTAVSSRSGSRGDRHIVTCLCRLRSAATSPPNGARELAELFEALINRLAASRGRAVGSGPARTGALPARGRRPGRATRSTPDGRRIPDAGECSICVATLPVVTRQPPGARIMWLDSPATSTNSRHDDVGYLGRMFLAGACRAVGIRGFGAARPARSGSSCTACASSTAASCVNLDRSGVHRSTTRRARGNGVCSSMSTIDVLDPIENAGHRNPVPGGMRAAPASRTCSPMSPSWPSRSWRRDHFGPPGPSSRGGGRRG